MGFLKGAKDEVIVNVKAQMTGDLGKKIVVPFKCRFVRYKVSDARDLMAKVESGDMTDEDLIRKVLIDWREMPGPDGEEVPFTPEALAEAVEIMGYRKAIIEGFINQQYEVDLKNR